MAAEVQSFGYGSLKAVHELTGAAVSTIMLGQKELLEGNVFDVDAVRKVGGGPSTTTNRVCVLCLCE